MWAGAWEGWAMPDNPAVTPRVIVHLDAEHHVVIEAFVYRPLLKQNGLHNTGVCGFILDENNCPGLTAANKLEVFDADANLLLCYRRRPESGIIDKKLFRLETQLFRSAAVDDLLLTRFHMSYPALDLHPEETIRSILALPFTQSIYASGRVFWRVWEPLLRDRGYLVGALLRDPFHEMAERLLILKLASSSQGAGIIDAVGPVVEAAAGHLRNIDLKDFAALEALLAAAPIELKAILYNPLTYQLTAQNAFDPPPMPATAVALESARRHGCGRTARRCRAVPRNRLRDAGPARGPPPGFAPRQQYSDTVGRLPARPPSGPQADRNGSRGLPNRRRRHRAKPEARRRFSPLNVK